MVGAPYLALTALTEEAEAIPSTVDETAETADPPPHAANKEMEIKQSANAFMGIPFQMICNHLLTTKKKNQYRFCYF
jgi:hypothetical protein